MDGRMVMEAMATKIKRTKGRPFIVLWQLLAWHHCVVLLIRISQNALVSC
jgi:hypothetical protein